MFARSALRSVEEDPDAARCVVVVKICLEVCGEMTLRGDRGGKSKKSG